jgi:transcriptional regulator
MHDGTVSDHDVPLFERFEHADVRALVDAYPLAWVCPPSGSLLDAALLPLVGVYAPDDSLVELIGHIPRSSPLFAALHRERRVFFLFRGPDSYISPANAGRRDWAPSWNFAQLRIEAEVFFDDALTEPALEMLIEKMEREQSDPWKIAELGARYPGMLEQIIGFRATGLTICGRYKLGQDERIETLEHIISSLPDGAMAEWMRGFAARR